MAKTMKKTIVYRNGRLPERLDEILGNADENDLRILVALMMAADEDGTVETEFDIGECLGLEKSEVDASLKFWRGAGMIGSAREDSKKIKPEKKIQSAHRGGALERHSVADYASTELADLLEKRSSLAQFVSEAQRVLGKTITYHETSIIVGLVDQLGFDEEAVLSILAYVVRLGKKTVRYAEKVAIGLFDEGITSTEDVVARIHHIEESAKTVSKIRNLFGMGARELTATEKKLFSAWIEKLGYGLDEIRLAYDITVDAIHTPAPKYVNSILERWYAEGLHTAADIEAFEEAKKGEKSKTDTEKSYDVDDFFEASLKRSYEELN